MARPLRLEYAGALYHITARGDRREDIFLAESDRTQHVNRRHGLVGHLFQGRYKAILVQKSGYLLELSRYLVLNPVRAKMVVDPADWPWSNYPATVGAVPSPGWLDTYWLLG